MKLLSPFVFLSFALTSCAPTKYSRGYDDQKFRLIQKGESIDNVINNIGLPLRALAITDHTGNIQTDSDLQGGVKILEIGLESIKIESEKAGRFIAMEYTMPVDGSSYERREIRIKRSLVIEVISAKYEE